MLRDLFHFLPTFSVEEAEFDDLARVTIRLVRSSQVSQECHLANSSLHLKARFDAFDSVSKRVLDSLNPEMSKTCHVLIKLCLFILIVQCTSFPDRIPNVQDVLLRSTFT